MQEAGVTYNRSNDQEPEAGYLRYTYVWFFLPEMNLAVNKTGEDTVDCLNRQDFFTLLDHWNKKSPEWKFVGK